MDKHEFIPRTDISTVNPVCAFVTGPNECCGIPASNDIHNVSPQPKTCSDCKPRKGADERFQDHVILCPRHTSVDDLYAAARDILREGEFVWDHFNGNPPPFVIFAIQKARAAVNKYEGRE